MVLHGDLAPLRPAGVTNEHALRVGLVWGAQWLTEPLCVLPAESPEVAAVIAAGCRDPFGFVPAAVSVSAPIDVDVPTTLTLTELPAADVMVGDVTARVAYGSLVVFDDRRRHGTLELATPRERRRGRRGAAAAERAATSADIIHGASFLTMTAPDQRVAYREGAFDDAERVLPARRLRSAVPRFSVLAAGGFSAAAALAAALAAGCRRRIRPVAVSRPPRRPSRSRRAPPRRCEEVGCDERTADSSVRYREPPANAPDLASRVFACAHLPTFDTGAGSPASELIQLVVSGRSHRRCKGLTHYTLRGCREDVNCADPRVGLHGQPAGLVAVRAVSRRARRHETDERRPRC